MVKYMWAVEILSSVALTSEQNPKQFDSSTSFIKSGKNFAIQCLQTIISVIAEFDQRANTKDNISLDTIHIL